MVKDPEGGDLSLKVWELERQIEHLEAEVVRLKEGQFTECEFQNLCHNMAVDGNPVDQEAVYRFKRGCEQYQRQLFGERVMSIEPRVLRKMVAEREIKYQNSFTIHSGKMKVSEYILVAPNQREDLARDRMKTYVLLWVRENRIAELAVPVFSTTFDVSDLVAAADPLFKGAFAEEAREAVRKKFEQCYADELE